MEGNKFISIFENDKLKLSTLIVGTIFFIAYIKQVIYYLFFKIDIYNYISLSEVLTPFINELAALFVVSIIFWGWVYLLQNEQEQKMLLNLFYPIFGGTVLLTFGLSIYPSNDFVINLFFTMLNILFLLIISIDIRTKFSQQLKKEHFYLFYYLHITIFLFIFSITLTIDRVRETKYIQHTENTYEFTLNDNVTIKSDSILSYVGKTNDYFFMYNKAEKSVTVYNRSGIIREKISKSSK